MSYFKKKLSCCCHRQSYCLQDVWYSCRCMV